MRIVFVEYNGEVTASWVYDSVSVGMANMVWQADARRGEVVAEVSVQTYDGPLTAERRQFYEEIFDLGRRYERERIQRRVNETEDILD